MKYVARYRTEDPAGQVVAIGERDIESDDIDLSRDDEDNKNHVREIATALVEHQLPTLKLLNHKIVLISIAPVD